MKIKNKKASHVGVVLSFVIFITFLIFLYSAVEPRIKLDKSKQFSLDFLKVELLKEISSNLTIITVSGEVNGNRRCLEIDIGDLFLEGQNAIVKDKEERIVGLDLSEDVLKIKSSKGVVEVFKIYFSKEFEDNSENLKKCSNAEIKRINTNEYVFEKKITETLEAVEIDYETIKNKFKLSIDTEFGFSFVDKAGQIIGTQEKDVSINIYAEEIPIQYVDENANINSGFINIKVC